MSIKHAAWTHGLGVELETTTWSALRQGFYTTVRPDGNLSGWVHFVIPTPVIVDGIRLKAESAMIRFTTGAGAKITNFHVYDGEKKIADHNALNFTGNGVFLRQDIPGNPQVLWGTAISVGVQFSATGGGNYIQFIGAGIDFYA
jgi:hypothetical protein